MTMVAYGGAAVVVSAVLFQGRISARLGALYQATGFLVQSTLVGGLFSLAVVALMVMAVGRLRPTDMGWNWRDLWPGLWVTLGFWTAMNAVLAGLSLVGDGAKLEAGWEQRGIGAVVGGWLGQLLGNALAEETMFRGLLLPQFYLKATPRFRHRAALAIAIVGSSALFAVSHFPNRLFIQGFTGAELLWDQVGLFVMGLVMATVFVVTRNLFVAVGLHALVNEPALIVHASSEAAMYAAWGGITVCLLLTWWLLSVDGVLHRDRRLK
jgi:membrane protease YdiL (CAAX protease family)